MLWDQSIDILRESILAYAYVCNGNLGAGILAVTFLARLALLPLGVRLARIAAVQQRAMASVQPELDRLRAQYKKDPRRLTEETNRVMKREHISPLAGLVGLVQVPVFIALYSAVSQASAIGGRFLWVRDLAKPDWPLTIVATLLTLLATTTGGSAPPQQRSMMLVITLLVTVAALSKMAAGIGLYWAVSSLVGAAQGWVVHRGQRHLA